MSNNVKTPEPISTAQVEKALWELTGFTGDQTVIDGILVVLHAWAAAQAEELAKSSERFRDGYYHSLTLLAEAVLDTGGRMRLVPPEAQPVLHAGQVDELADILIAKLGVATLEATQADQSILDLAERELDAAPPYNPDAPAPLADLSEKEAKDFIESLEQMRRGERVPATTLEEERKAALPKSDDEDWDEYITCTTCGDYQHYTEFHRDPKGRHGRKSKCKTCCAEAKRNRSAA